MEMILKKRMVAVSFMFGVIASLLIFGSAQLTEAKPPSLVALWQGNGNADDFIGGHDGTIVGDVSYGEGRVINKSAFAFTGGYGIDQGVDVPTAPELDVKTAITIVAWIKPLGEIGPIVEYKAPEFPYQPFGIHFWQYTSSTGLYVNLVDSPNHGYHMLEAPHAITPGVWNHVAMTYDKATGMCILYANGSQAATADFGPIDMKTDKGLYIGWRPSTPWDGWYSFNGGIDDVAIFNRALSPDEINAIYTGHPIVSFSHKR